MSGIAKLVRDYFDACDEAERLEKISLNKAWKNALMRRELAEEALRKAAAKGAKS